MRRAAWGGMLVAVLLAVGGRSGASAEPREGRLRDGNPVYEHRLVQTLPRSEKLAAASSPVECPSYTAFAAALQEEFGHRNTDFSVHLHYGFAFDEVEEIVHRAHGAMLAADDYLRFSYAGQEIGWKGVDGDVILTFRVDYLTTREQEDAVATRVRQVVDHVVTAAMGEEEREKVIHDWIVGHVEYDVAAEEDPLRYTAYGALANGRAVCQGYALLGLRMLQEAGIAARIRSGLGSGEDHAWNMVRLCGQWYHLDLTWDDPVSPDPGPSPVRYDYFNRSDEQMRRDHTWEDEGYPPASTAYLPGICSGETEALAWATDPEAAFAAAGLGKLVLLVAGREGDPNTRRLLDGVIQSMWPGVKPLVREHFVVWFADVDTGAAWQVYAGGLGSFTLPLTCIIDPQDPGTYRDRDTGAQSTEALHARLQAVLPAPPSAIVTVGWGCLKAAWATGSRVPERVGR